MPLVSVITPVFNSAKWLPETLESVRNQTLGDWEHILVDDGSTDGSVELIERAAELDSRIRLVKMPENGGPARARNKGVETASGRYIAFLDADDLWLPEKLEAQVQFMKQNDIGFSFTSYRSFGADGSQGNLISIPEKVGYNDLLKGNVIGCLTVMLDREKIPFFTMPTIGHEDYVAWLRILKQGHVAWGLQRDLARYRLSSQSVSGNKRRSASWTWNIYRDIEGLPLTTACWCFANYSFKALRKHFVGGHNA